MNFLFLFLDGVGLGEDQPSRNPLAQAEMPYLESLLGGAKLVAQSVPVETERASLFALDACLGVEGLPQSATGQATLLTGQNVPQILGYHYGPKPNPPVAAFVQNGNLFSVLKGAGCRSALLNAYPPRYFAGIESGRRLYSAIPLAATSAGLELMNHRDLESGRALAADFTAQAWREHLNLPATPLLAPFEAGERLAALAQGYDFAFFEYWLTDYAGHHQAMEPSLELLQTFDQVLGGLLKGWEDSRGLVLLTSDHGNLEDLGTRRHTRNPVPGLLVGAPDLRRAFIARLHSPAGNFLPGLDQVAPAIRESLISPGSPSHSSSIP